MDHVIERATEKDREELLSLYITQKGRKYCAWDEDYPSDETIDQDLEKDGLFVMRSEGSIVAAISIEEDEAVAGLDCWDDDLSPMGELARLAVLPKLQGRGIGRIMMQYAMDELKKRGCKGIHILVNKENIKAIRCYAVFGFKKAGECHMYDQDFLCYERKL